MISFIFYFPNTFSIKGEGVVVTQIIVTIKRQRLTSLNLDFLNRIEGGYPPKHLQKG